jgi:hypothetical protein
MSIVDWVVVIHVLGWVFWLGTDVGVFFGARFAERSDLSVEARLAVLELGMLLDRAPRFAVPIVWFTGTVLSTRLGYDVLPLWFAAPLTLIWLLVTWFLIFGVPGSSVQRAALWAQTLIYSGVIVGMGGGATWLLATDQIPLWLALKAYGYVIVAIAALTLEKWFAPVGALFQQLATEGASAALDARIRTALRPVYPVVLLIYAGTLLAGISGLLKPL